MIKKYKKVKVHKKRNNNKSKIYELKRFIQNELETSKSKITFNILRNILVKMSDLFDIPRMENIPDEQKEYPIDKEEKHHKPETLEEAKAKARKLFGMK